MLGFLIAVIVLLACACLTLSVFSQRAAYAQTLRETDACAENIINAVKKQLELYERLYALVFFFANDSSVDKQKFSLSESRNMQEVFDTYVIADSEINLLMKKVHDSPDLLAERSVSVKNITEELEKLDKDIACEVSLFNDRIESARIQYMLPFSKRLYRGLGECAYLPIVFKSNP